MANESDASPEIWKLNMMKGNEKEESWKSLILPNSAFNFYISYPSQFLSFLFVVADCLPIDYIDNSQRKQSSSLWPDPQGSGRSILQSIPILWGHHRNSGKSGEPPVDASKNTHWPGSWKEPLGKNSKNRDVPEALFWCCICSLLL